MESAQHPSPQFDLPSERPLVGSASPVEGSDEPDLLAGEADDAGGSVSWIEQQAAEFAATAPDEASRAIRYEERRSRLLAELAIFRDDLVTVQSARMAQQLPASAAKQGV